jgi:hypothetical protein
MTEQNNVNGVTDENAGDNAGTAIGDAGEDIIDGVGDAGKDVIDGVEDAGDALTGNDTNETQENR